jgi:glyoxylase-like metal-dependent hydrolase (beta-lactamase superfamily II)
LLKIVPLELDTHFAEGTVNAFLAIGETVTLIDAGNLGRESYQQLKSKIHNAGVALTDIDHVLLTHIHIDHAGGIPYLQEEADLPIFVHEQARESINHSLADFERNTLYMKGFLEQCGADPEKHIFSRNYKQENWGNVHYLKEGDRMPLGGVPYEVVFVPGHSQCDILLWDSETGAAFAGDHLLKAFSVNAFIEPPQEGERERPKPLLQYRNSLEKVSRLPLGLVYPGHGDPFTDHLALIEKRLQEQEKRCEQILKILADGPKAIFDICREMYPHLQGTAVFLGLSQIQGHIDLLEVRNLVTFEKHENILHICKR